MKNFKFYNPLFATFPLGMFLLMGLTLSAAPLSPDEALARLKTNPSARISPVVSPKLVTTIYSADQLPAIYIFNGSDGKGNLILSADDMAPALLGYTDSSMFIDGELPSNVEWWLNSYASQIEYQRSLENGLSDKKKKQVSKSPKNDFAPIEPMVKTTWNQDAPFWDLLPELGNKKCVAGCVATAMAQVINYFQYPEKAKGIVSYSPPGFRDRLSMNLGGENLDWDNMLDHYTPGLYSEEEAHAVAYLTKACAYSVKMQFSPEASGAYAHDIPNALTTNFGFDKSVQYLLRDYFTYDEWSSMIYDNLANIGPVLCGGLAEEGGHEFVCDGYAGDGYFHFNWGWGGTSDGYYLLDSLDPINQGIGGALGGFHLNQDLVLGIRPATEDSNTASSQYFVLYSPLRAQAIDDVLYIGYEEETYIGQMMQADSYFSLGFIIENMENPSDVKYGLTDCIEVDLPGQYVISFIFDENERDVPEMDLTPLGLEEGVNYKFTLATLDLSVEDSVLQPVGVQNGYPNYVIVTYEDGQYVVNNLEIGNISFEYCDLPENLVYGQKNKIESEIINLSEYQISRHFCFGLFDMNGRFKYRSAYMLETLNPGEFKEIVSNVSFMPLWYGASDDFEAGEYYFSAVDLDTGSILLEPIVVYVEAATNPGDTPGDATIDSLQEDLKDGVLRVYNLTGLPVMTTSEISDLQNLPNGIYIINGKKITL